VTVGSNSNVAERGMAAEAERAAFWEVDLSTGAHRVFASGLRNPTGMAWAPGGALWTVVNERDEIGSDLVPDCALGSHTASLGLAASAGTGLPARFANGMFIGQHGSWNRRPHSGYRVIFVPFNGSQPTGAPPLDVLTGFLDGEGHAYGRPVGVAVDRQGGLLVADDVGNVVWRVTVAP
jgi:glucose/arabinose dehydrogenase